MIQSSKLAVFTLCNDFMLSHLASPSYGLICVYSSNCFAVAQGYLYTCVYLYRSVTIMNIQDVTVPSYNYTTHMHTSHIIPRAQFCTALTFTSLILHCICS